MRVAKEQANQAEKLKKTQGKQGQIFSTVVLGGARRNINRDYLVYEIQNKSKVGIV
jgi:hypothetical protein